MSNLNKWKDYTITDDIKNDIEMVEKTYETYLCDKNDDWKYMKLKQAIYDLSLTIKQAVVHGEISSACAEDMKTYFWGLLL
ncbi:MAG: hypothetical protein EOM50_09985 [Erysipelotrichia bacterium]|nr:hypothetical protein [Erysipelotrichia bacterium]NCC54927.1 hypothetical protein [Erysipelotrichia bacterium]